MNTKQNMDVTFTDRALLTIPEYRSIPRMELNITNIREGERRLVEAQVVNGATYAELEFTFNEGYREAKKHLSSIGYQRALALKYQREAKSEAIIDRYSSWLKEVGLKDNATVRDAFLQRDERYVSAQDRIDMLTAIESYIEGKVKVFENVCRYMRKAIDLEIRSGIMNSNKYCS